MTVAVSHSYEIALRIFFPQHTPNQTMANELRHRTMQYIPHGGLPSKEALFRLYRAWHAKHPDWSHIETLQPVLHLAMCWTSFHDDRLELSKTVQAMLQQGKLSVWKALANLHRGIRAGDRGEQNLIDSNRQGSFIQALQKTLKLTVRRKLLTNRDNVPIPDVEDIAIEGAMIALRGGELRLTKTLIEKQFRSTAADSSDQSYRIPPLSIPGMDETGVYFRTLANTFALHNVYAKLAPGVSEVLERTLSDASHSRQRSAMDNANSQERGGPGTSKTVKSDRAKGKRTAPAEHVTENQDCTLDLRSLCDGRDVQKQLEARELLDKAYKLAVDRWGSSGKAMLLALRSGATYKEAASRAGITPPAVWKRLNLLREKLDLSNY